MIGYSAANTVPHMNNQQTTSLSVKIAGLDATQIHPLHRTCFGQYQASSAGQEIRTAISFL